MANVDLLLEMKGITKIYNRGKSNELTVLNDINLQVRKGEFISIVGKSGSGKSTLMNIIGMLDMPTYGFYNFEDKNVFEYTDKQVTAFRRKKVGFVFQNFELISDENALKNVAVPMLYAGIGKKKRIKRAVELLKMVGMEERMDHMPNQLSGGQKQRVSIARALSNDPELLIADEPTGALDNENGKKIIELFHQLHSHGKTIIIVTHDREIALEAQRMITISDGRIEKDQMLV